MIGIPWAGGLVLFTYLNKIQIHNVSISLFSFTLRYLSSTEAGAIVLDVQHCHNSAALTLHHARDLLAIPFFFFPLNLFKHFPIINSVFYSDNSLQESLKVPGVRFSAGRNESRSGEASGSHVYLHNWRCVFFLAPRTFSQHTLSLQLWKHFKSHEKLPCFCLAPSNYTQDLAQLLLCL